MPAMTYNSLISLVMNYINTNNANVEEHVQNFIYQAEQRICRESKNIGLEVYVTGAFTPNNAVIAKPARWRRSITFNFGTGEDNNVRNQLLLRSYEFLRMYAPDPAVSGVPQFYSDYGFDHILIAPTPNDAYPFEYGYLQLPQPLSEENQTNWLTNNAPDVLLYATLLEANTYVQNPEMLAIWKEMYDRGIGSLNGQDGMRITDRASNRNAD